MHKWDFVPKIMRYFGVYVGVLTYLLGVVLDQKLGSELCGSSIWTC